MAFSFRHHFRRGRIFYTDTEADFFKARVPILALIARRISGCEAGELSMVWGDRKNNRVSFERGIDAVLMGIDGTWRRNCKLCDVSETGARLIVDGSLSGMAAKQFFLLLTPRGFPFRRCELVRVNGDEIGVRFLTQREMRDKQPRKLASSLP